MIKTVGSQHRLDRYYVDRSGIFHRLHLDEKHSEQKQTLTHSKRGIDEYRQCDKVGFYLKSIKGNYVTS